MKWLKPLTQQVVLKQGDRLGIQQYHSLGNESSRSEPQMAKASHIFISR